MLQGFFDTVNYTQEVEIRWVFLYLVRCRPFNLYDQWYKSDTSLVKLPLEIL